jgi:hypothetical protein
MIRYVEMCDIFYFTCSWWYKIALVRNQEYIGEIQENYDEIRTKTLNHIVRVYNLYSGTYVSPNEHARQY